MEMEVLTDGNGRSVVVIKVMTCGTGESVVVMEVVGVVLMVIENGECGDWVNFNFKAAS